MSNVRINAFWEPGGTASSTAAPHYSLALHPDGRYSGDELQLMFDSRTPRAEMLAIADRVLAAVQVWRDDIAADGGNS